MKAFTSLSDPASAITASTVPPASLTSFAVSLTLSLRSTAISFAPSLVNSSEAARPMPLAGAGDDDGFAFEAAHEFLPCVFTRVWRLQRYGISNKISNAEILDVT